MVQVMNDEVDNDGSLDYEYLCSYGSEGGWRWSLKYRSKEARIYGQDKRTVCFHPHWSNGTAGIIGTQAINTGSSRLHFWEVQITDRIFGTSTMFGIGTKSTKLHSNTFINMIGYDENSWGLSHKGSLYHNGKERPFCRPFRENERTIVGLLYDHFDGTLSYYKDSQYLGVAFTGLNEVNEYLYPIISSTAAKTELRLNFTRRDFINLQERCKSIIKMCMRKGEWKQAENIPTRLLNFIQSESDLEDEEDPDAQMIQPELTKPVFVKPPPFRPLKFAPEPVDFYLHEFLTDV